MSRSDGDGRHRSADPPAPRVRSSAVAPRSGSGGPPWRGRRRPRGAGRGPAAHAAVRGQGGDGHRAPSRTPPTPPSCRPPASSDHPPLISVDPAAAAARVETPALHRIGPGQQALARRGHRPRDRAGPGGADGRPATTAGRTLDGDGRTLAVACPAGVPGCPSCVVHAAVGRAGAARPGRRDGRPGGRPGLAVARTLPPAFAAQVGVGHGGRRRHRLAWRSSSSLTVLLGTDQRSRPPSTRTWPPSWPTRPLRGAHTIDVTVPQSPDRRTADAGGRRPRPCPTARIVTRRSARRCLTVLATRTRAEPYRWRELAGWNGFNLWSRVRNFMTVPAQSNYFAVIKVVGVGGGGVNAVNRMIEAGLRGRRVHRHQHRRPGAAHERRRPQARHRPPAHPGPRRRQRSRGGPPGRRGAPLRDRGGPEGRRHGLHHRRQGRRHRHRAPPRSSPRSPRASGR